jgi:prepilin signal peptidase PulO-like enzyme (type II secretory pathway)
MFINYLACIFVFIFGLCIGSFLNAVIYRLEENKNLKGRSFCPHCKHTLFWIDLFPIFSFLFLGGKCRYCHKKISIQYPLVEISTGLIFLLILNRFNVIPSLTGNLGTPQTLWIPAFAGMTIFLSFLFYIASALIIIFVYDFKHYIIPDKVLFPAIVITFLFRLFGILWIPAFAGMTGDKVATLTNYFFAILVGAGFFFLIWLVSKGKWMGFGDVKLAVLMGILLGLPNVLVALFLAFFFGAIIGVMLMIYGKKGLKSEIPFGPFLISGTFIALFWGEQIVQWYLRIFNF